MNRVCLMRPLRLPAAAFVASLVILTTFARAQAPVLAYSARIGAGITEVQAIAVGLDKSVYLASRTNQDKLFLAKLAPDGQSVECGIQLDGNASAMAIADDGSVLLTGFDAPSSFPITTSAQPASGRFLLRAGLCSQGITFATWLPSAARGVAVAASPTSIWVATDNSVLRYDAGASSPSAEFPVNGMPGSIAFANGRLYVTGTRGTGPCRAFLLRLDPVTMAADFNVSWGDGPVAAGTSLVVQRDGSAWVAGPAIVDGPQPAATFSPRGGIPYWGGDAALTRIAGDGTVAGQRVLPHPLGGFHPSLGAGADGTLWLALPGSVRYPHSLPDSLPAEGVLLLGFDAQGQELAGSTLIPCHSGAAVAFSGSGRIAIGSLTPGFPLTPGAVDSRDPSGATLLVSDLDQFDAPALRCDREILDVPTIRLGSFLHPGTRTISCRASDDSAIALSATLSPASSSAATTDRYAMAPSGDRTPFTVQVSTVGDASMARVVLVLLAPGTQGPLAIPVQSYVLSPQTRFAFSERFAPLPHPSDRVLETTLSLAWHADSLTLPVPFRITPMVPWASVEPTEGIAPAQVRVQIRTAGLPPGIHNAAIRVEGVGPSTVTLPITIGSALLISNPGTLQVPAGRPFTHKLQIRSTGEPLSFTVESPLGLSVSPSSGTTPAEVTVTFDPQGVAVFERRQSFLNFHFDGSVQSAGFTYQIVPRDAVALEDSLRFLPGAPGKRIVYLASGSGRCDPVPPVQPPWPLELGGCTLRVDGQAMPLSSITEEAAPPNPSFLLQPLYAIQAQLPYDVSGTVSWNWKIRAGSALRFPWKSSSRLRSGLPSTASLPCKCRCARWGTRSPYS
ncbi:MAG: hypothetical protein JNK87_16650 [Bryobacterales bacterium]|nr:hypothetical protein [Bryobacterales bacterium]